MLEASGRAVFNSDTTYATIRKSCQEKNALGLKIVCQMWHDKCPCRESCADFQAIFSGFYGHLAGPDSSHELRKCEGWSRETCGSAELSGQEGWGDGDASEGAVSHFPIFSFFIFGLCWSGIMVTRTRATFREAYRELSTFRHPLDVSSTGPLDPNVKTNFSQLVVWWCSITLPILAKQEAEI